MKRRTLTFTVVGVFLAWNVVTYVFILSKQPSKVSHSTLTGVSTQPSTLHVLVESGLAE